MKAQFAIIETAVSLAIILSVVAFVSKQTSISTNALHAQEQRLEQSVALYDILYQLQHNSSSNYCILQPNCTAQLEYNYTRIFRISTAKILVNSSMPINTSNVSSRCAPVYLPAVNSTERVCAIVGG